MNMFGHMMRAQYLREATASANFHTIWISDEATATRNLFTQNCLFDGADMRLLSGKINASRLFSNSLKRSPRTNILLRIAVNFELTFDKAPSLSVSANTLICGVKCLDESAIVTKVTNATSHSGEILLEITNFDRVLSGLYITWMALGSKPINSYRSMQ